MEGTLLGGCRILSELGSGGMGTVYLAETVDRTAGLPPGASVAVKVIHPHLLETPGFFKRFLREAQIGQQVRHENVVRTFDCDAVRKGGADHHFIVMEYVHGQTLRALRQELKRVPEELCRHIGCEIARGLGAIHAAGVIHRDLKPENVLITSEEVVKVMDLGVARLQDEVIRLSQSGHFVGSLEYAAPEQFRSAGQEADGRADLYALGVLLYELGTGQHPHRDEDPRKVLRRILDEEPRRAGEINPQLSPFFEEVVHRLLEKDPERRFPTASEVATVLAEGERSAWWSARAQALRLETRKPLRRIRIPRDTALYGRDADLAKLRDLYDRAQGGDGQVLLVEGEAGIGKTRLVDEFVGRLRQSGEDLNFLFGSYPPGGAATAAGAFSTAYREHFGAHGLESTLRSYLGGSSLLVPGFAAVLRGDMVPEDAEQLTKDSLQTVFVRVTRALAKERPTVVLIEDLHFAPEDGRALFASLALAAPGSPLLLVGTTRRGLPASWTAQIERLDHATKHALERLGPKDLVKLLEEAFRSERLAHELAAPIAIKSDGNPLFAFEIIRGLREGQLIQQSEDGSWSSAEVIEKIQIPSRVLDLIQARIADTSEEEKDVLGVASCCGFEFDATLVGDALGLARIPTLKLFAGIEKKHALVRCAGERFVFDHHQIQEALYAALPPPLAREYHAALGEALERREDAVRREPSALDGAVAVDLCEHHLRGSRPAQGLRYLDAALQHLFAGYMNAQAVTLADRALDAPDLLEGSRRLEVLKLKAQRLELLGRHDQERATLDEALALAATLGDEREHAEMMGFMGWHLSRTADYAGAQEILERVETIAHDAGHVKLEAMAMGNLGLILHRMGRYPEARDHHERHLELSRALEDCNGEAKALGNLGLVFHRLGELDAAREHHEASLRIARECGSRLIEGLATGNLGALMLDLGRYDDAQAQHEHHLALAREIGDRRGEVVANGNLGFVLHLRGRFEEALDHFERQMALAREIGDRRGESLATGNLGIVYRALGRLEEARAQHEHHIALSEELRDRRGVVIATGNLANVFSSMGRYAEAQAQHERHLELSRAIGYRKGEALARHNLGMESLRLGDLEDAQEHLTAAAVLAADVGFLSLVADAALAQAHLADMAGEGGVAEERYEEAVALAREIGAAHGVARALTAHGGFLAEHGRAEQAGPLLEEALERAREAQSPGPIVLAACQRAGLPGQEPGPALDALAAHEQRLEHGDRMRARHLLWRATGEAEHLREARRLLDRSLEATPPARHETMLARVPLHGAIEGDWTRREQEAARP